MSGENLPPSAGFGIGDLSGLRFSEARAHFDAGRWMEALVEAEELLDVAPDHLDALFLVGEACLELGDAFGGEAAYARFLELVPGDTRALSGLAIARYELTDMDGCLSCTRQALDADGTIPEAWYFQGLALQWLGIQEESQAAFEHAYSLDKERFPLLVMLGESEWEAALAAGKALLDTKLSEWLEAVPIVSHQLPSLEVLRAATPPLSPFSPGLYWGATPDPGADAWQGRPEEIRLFRGNLERLALHAGDLPRRIAEVLRSEALDWLGMPLDSHPLST